MNKTREFKFRVWDLKKNDWGNVCLLECGGLGRPNRLEYLYHADNPENYVIQQFTGLVDKNGKEIYEGDIVIDCHGRKGEVKWNEVHSVLKCYFVSTIKIIAVEDLFHIKFQSEVVGNIYSKIL